MIISTFRQNFVNVLSDTLMNGECGIGAEVAIPKRTILFGAALLPIMAAASYDQRYQHSRSGFAMDYAEEQRGGVAEEMPPKIKAEENPWYLLATLYGVPEQSERELRERIGSPETGTLPQILMRQHARD